MQCACAILYCHLWPDRPYHNFRHHLINGTSLDKRVFNIKHVFWDPLKKFVCEFSHYKNSLGCFIFFGFYFLYSLGYIFYIFWVLFFILFGFYFFIFFGFYFLYSLGFIFLCSLGSIFLSMYIWFYSCLIM